MTEGKTTHVEKSLHICNSCNSYTYFILNWQYVNFCMQCGREFSEEEKQLAKAVNSCHDESLY